MYRNAAMVLMLLVGTVSGPSARADNVTTYGAGLRSCRAYLEARGGDIADQVAFVDWLSGYFSAVNRTSSHRNNLLGLTDLKVALDRLDGYCRARPDLQVAAATEMLVLGAKPGPAAHATEATTYGAADKACQVFIEAREQKQTDYWAEFLHWLGGYLSGVNAVSLRTNNVLGNAELADAVHWLDSYCNMHPITPFGSAAEALISAVPQLGSNFTRND